MYFINTFLAIRLSLQITMDSFIRVLIPIMVIITPMLYGTNK